MGGFSDFVDGLKQCNWVLWSRFLGVLSAALLFLFGGMALSASLFSSGTAWWAMVTGAFVTVGECKGFCPCCGAEGGKLRKLCKLMDSFIIKSGLYTFLFIMGVIFYVYVKEDIGPLLCFITLEFSAICYMVAGMKKRGEATGGDVEAPAQKTKPKKNKDSAFASSLFSAAKDNPEVATLAAGAAVNYAKENPEAAKAVAGQAIEYGQQNPEWAKGIATSGSAYGASTDANPFAV